MKFPLKLSTILAALIVATIQLVKPAFAKVSVPTSKVQNDKAKNTSKSKLKVAATQDEIEKYSERGGGLPKTKSLTNGEFENPNAAYKMYLLLPQRTFGGWDWLKSKVLVQTICDKVAPNISENDTSLSLLDVIFLTTSSDGVKSPLDALGVIDFPRQRQLRRFIHDEIVKKYPNSSGIRKKSAYLITTDIDLLRALENPSSIDNLTDHIRKRELTANLNVDGIEAAITEELNYILSVAPTTDAIQKRFSEQDVGIMISAAEWFQDYLNENPTGGGGQHCEAK